MQLWRVLQIIRLCPGYRRSRASVGGGNKKRGNEREAKLNWNFFNKKKKVVEESRAFRGGGENIKRNCRDSTYSTKRHAFFKCVWGGRDKFFQEPR